jgi:hypothetical protein
MYPAGDSDENNRYVVYNYLEDVWYDGTIDRTTWNDSDIFDRPYATQSDGTLFVHEQGKNNDATGLKAYIQTSDFDIGNGDLMYYVDRVIPDGDFTKNINYTFFSKKYPNSTNIVEKGPFVVTSATRKFHPRTRGRQGQMRISTSVTDSDFRLGSNRIFIKPDGGR